MITELADLILHVKDGARVAIPPNRSGPAITASLALIEKGVRNLHLIAVPSTGLQADLLIGAGCVEVMESAGVTLDEQGQAPRFVAAVKSGSITLKDSTCPAIISALQAGEKGIPFIPMRGLIGSDLLAHRPDYRVVENPFAPDDQIVVLPAIRPDIALFHAPLADRNGNVWIGKSRELMTMAHAAYKTIITVETVTDDDLMSDPMRAPACIPAHYITAVARVENGSWPIGLVGHSKTDADAMARYARLAQTEDGFRAFLRTPRPVAA